MKKIVLILMIIFNVIFAAQTDKYLDYTNKLIYYGFELKKFDKIKPPFEIEIKNNNAKIITKSGKIMLKSIKITPMLIFNNQAFVLIQEYLGGQLIKKYKRWIKVNSRIGMCKVTNIALSKVILKCKNKKLIKTLNKKIPGIKETK